MPNGTRTISVAMATYNGEKYISEQLNSIIYQTLRPSEIIIVDDASSDKVCELAETILSNSGIHYTIYKNPDNIGYMRSFERALTKVTGAYTAFSDQDDVWHLDKLEKLMQAMEELENEYSNSKIPLLVFSDVEVTDEKLNVVYHSFNKMQKFSTHRMIHSLSASCVQNVISGMSMMVNQELLRIAIPFPKQAIHHDWWLALVCAVSGIIKYVDTPLVYYRQHNTNTLGANMYHDILWANIIKRNIKDIKKLVKYIFYDLKYELFHNYRNHVKMHSEQKIALSQIANTNTFYLEKIAFHLNRGGIFSVLWLITHGVLPPAWQRKIFFCISMLKR